MTNTNPHCVLMVDLSRHYGGADVRVIDLARLLDGQINYAVVTLEGSGVYRRLNDAALKTAPQGYKRADPRLLLSICRLIREKNCTIVDAHNVQSQFWGLIAAFIERVPHRISTVHSSYGLTERGLKRFMYEYVLKLNALLGCRFIAVSESVYNYLITIGIKKEKISLIHNAIYVDENPKKTIHNTLREFLGFDDKDTIICSVGRLELVKGHSYLIDAIAETVKTYPYVRCVIVGEGRMKDTLESQINALGLTEHVKLLGFRTDVIDILRQCDIFCMPSLSEGLPYALLEACLCKLTVVASDVGGMAEFLTNEENAILVPPENPVALASAFECLLENPDDMHSLAQSALELVKKNLSPQTMYDGTLKAYGIY
ncbi:MAG: glycosyltransferase family 4 protein [Candidatus Magnetoovum sp. WYHC-5]|nr:glycosyltransferase family 4 protein [Candidatus Magnetoovum sp. WYHC-5]